MDAIPFATLVAALPFVIALLRSLRSDGAI
jgi:hypothetical protein